MKKKVIVIAIVAALLGVGTGAVFVAKTFTEVKTDAEESSIREFIGETETEEESSTEEMTTLYESESIEVINPTASLLEGEMEYEVSYELGTVMVTERDLQSFENFMADERLHAGLSGLFFDAMPIYDESSFECGPGWCSIKFVPEGYENPKPRKLMIDVVDGVVEIVYDDMDDYNRKELPTDMKDKVLPAEEETFFIEGYVTFNNSAINTEPIKFVWDAVDNGDHFSDGDLSDSDKQRVTSELYDAANKCGGLRVVCNYLLEYGYNNGNPITFNGYNDYGMSVSYYVTVNEKDIELYFEKDGDENALFIRYY